MKHEIDVIGLQEWLTEVEVTFASSTRERKRLSATPNGELIIRVDNKIVWQGIQPYAAVEKYNSITEPFKQEPFTL